VMGWLMLVTLPGGLLAFVFWLMALILHRVTWRKRFSTELSAIRSPPSPA
jgi:hypothetical protein